MSENPVIAIAGRQQDTKNYEQTLSSLNISCKTSLTLGEIRACDGLLLPGGGDITPAFFGQKNAGSKKIDTELDIIQLQALEQMLNAEKPILGICKGMQIINVFFGGTIIQHMNNSDKHAYIGHDQLHESTIVPDTFLFSIYGKNLLVNSAHHQCIGKLGRELQIAQYTDTVPEALFLKDKSVFGVQWHPERLFPQGMELLSFFGKLLTS